MIFYVKLSRCLQTKLCQFPGQNKSTLLVSNMHNGNIETFWHRKLYIKTWYSLKSLWILLSFLVWFLKAKNSRYHQVLLIVSHFFYCFPEKLQNWLRFYLFIQQKNPSNPYQYNENIYFHAPYLLNNKQPAQSLFIYAHWFSR